MATRDLDRLARYVTAHRMELFPSYKEAARAAGISKDTWKKIEKGREDVRPTIYPKVAKALGWALGDCMAVAEGGEPVLTDHSGGSPTVSSPLPGAAAVRRWVLEAARTTLPTVPIGDIDAFEDELVEVMRRAGEIRDGD